MRELLSRLWDRLHRDRLDAELDAELRFHREQLEREARAEGVAPDEARSMSRRRLGNITRVMEDARDRWSLPGLDSLIQDTRYALRGLRRSPGFALTVIITLALGIGANATMFGVIDGLMFRPHPFLRDPSNVHRVYLQWNDRGRERTEWRMEYARYLDLAKETTTFSETAAMTSRILAVGVGDASREHQVGIVSASFFDFFDARPAAGRFFLPSEDTTPRGADVAVLGHAYWQTELGGRNVLGETLQVNNVPCTIIGVAPAGFVGVSDDRAPAVFIPITTFAASQPAQQPNATYFSTYKWRWMEMMVRRKPGVSIEAASADLSKAHVTSWHATMAQEPLAPSGVARPRAIAGAMKLAAGPEPGLEARTVQWVGGVAMIVLLIACSNVTSLFLARAIRRRRETALRLALGVRRSRLMGQWFTESLILALLGGLVGVIVAHWWGAALRRLFLPDGTVLPVLTDWRTLSVAAALALVAGVMTGLAPALFAGRGDLTGTLKAGAREGTYHRSRTRSALLVAQGALSVVLLVGAALFVRSLSHASAVRLGYDANPLLLVTRNLRGMPMDADEQLALGRRLLHAARTIPGVERAAMASSLPFSGSSVAGLYVAGIDSVRRLGEFTYQTASADYFRTMGTRLLRGRSFAEQDRSGAPLVAVVSEAMARTLWPGRDALGQCMRIFADTMPCTTVVGIAENAVHDLVQDERLRYYLPVDQFPNMGSALLLLRMRGEPGTATEHVRLALQSVMPGQAYVTVQPMRELVAEQRRSWQLGATMFSAFGVLALVVAAIGLYGVIAYSVAQRMHELGVRIALGAQSLDVIGLVIGQGVRLALAGVAAGIALVLAFASALQPLLFQQSANDPAVLGFVAAIMIAVALLASGVPALRATRADPNSVLRAE